MRAYSIGDLSAQSGVKVPTIRCYEQSGLIDAPPVPRATSAATAPPSSTASGSSPTRATWGSRWTR